MPHHETRPSPHSVKSWCRSLRFPEDQLVVIPDTLRPPSISRENPFERAAQNPPQIDPGVDLKNIKPGTTRMLDELIGYGLVLGWTIRITSGYRSPLEQAALRARWDAGDRRGLVTRPARSSSHTRGEAVDLVVLDDPDGSRLQELGQWASLVGYTWGGTFRSYDPVHFQEDMQT